MSLGTTWIHFDWWFGSDLLCNRRWFCVHSLPEHELQKESRDVEEEQKATGGCGFFNFYIEEKSLRLAL